MYYPRIIDRYMSQWATATDHKPLLLRGARQVGKSTAVRHLAEQFESFVEVNFERQPLFGRVFDEDLDVSRIVPELAAIAGQSIVPGRTLLFLDEIQACPRAIMSLRFFRDDLPSLHVVAAGSLLEFALRDLPTFGVGRIHSMFVQPMSFDEFLQANGETQLMSVRGAATATSPLSAPLHQKIIRLFRTFLLVGGMPEAVSKWIETRDYIACRQVQDDIVLTYEDDFAKYGAKVDPTLLRLTLRSAAVQVGSKFVHSRVGIGYGVAQVREALELLILAGILIPVTHTSANGVPLGSEADSAYRKMLVLDTGLLLRLLDMATANAAELTEEILTGDVTQLVNRGAIAEMVAGLELLRYMPPNLRHELFYWIRGAKNSQAELDYVAAYRQTVLPIEVKAATRGGMKSLWLFMREKHLGRAVRCSLENFHITTYIDHEDGDAARRVIVCPLYALSRLFDLLRDDDAN